MPTMPKIFIASDHAGFELKHALVEHVHTLGYDVVDMGAVTNDPEDDYPDFITPLAKRVASEPNTRGIVIGGSGQGEAMCANRVPAIRAAVFYVIAASTAIMPDSANSYASAEEFANPAPSAASPDKYEIVRRTREHNDANVLSLGARFVSVDEAREAVRIFLETEFSGSKRHLRRLAKY